MQLSTVYVKKKIELLIPMSSLQKRDGRFDLCCMLEFQLDITHILSWSCMEVNTCRSFNVAREHISTHN